MKKSIIHLGGTARSEEDLMALHELGLDFAEIPITDLKDFQHVKERYKRLKGQLGLYFLGHGPREGDPNDVKGLEKKYFPKLTRILSILPEMDIRIFTIHLWLDPRYVKQKVISHKIKLLEAFTKKARESNVIACLENLSESADQLDAVFSALPLLDLTLDLGHAQLLTDENTSFGLIEKYPDRIKHIHLHDNRGGNSPSDDLHLPPGKGTVPLKQIFKKLKSIGYKDTMTLELKPWEIKMCLQSVRERLKMFDKRTPASWGIYSS